MQAARHLFLSISLVFVSTTSHAEWKPYGPPGASIKAIVSDVSFENFFTASDPVYTSEDAGMTWEALPDLPNSDYCKDALVVGASDPALLVCTHGGEVYRWNDESSSWEEKTNGIEDPAPPYGRQCFDLSVASVTDTRVFLGCSTGLFYSDNFGDLWQKASLRNTSDMPQMVEASANGAVYVNTSPLNGTVYRVEPNLTEVTFFVCKPGLPCRALDGAMIWPNPDDPDEIVMIFDKTVYHSTDAGENWSNPSGGTVPTNPNTASWLYGAPTIFGVTSTYSLDTEMMSWELLWSRPISSHYRAIPKSDVPGELLLGSYSGSVWSSVNNGASWEYSSTGMGSFGQIRAIAVIPSVTSTLYVGKAQEGVWKTTDDGLTWEGCNNGFDIDAHFGISIRSLAADPLNPNHLLAGTEVTGGLPAGLYRTENGGQSWTRVQVGPTSITKAIHFVGGSPNVILAGTLGGGVWRSVDSGLTFQKMPEFPQYSNINDFAQEVGGRLFAPQQATFNTQGGVFISDNAGANWTFVENPGGLASLAADPSHAGRLMGGFPGGGMVLTTDNGTTWTPVNTGLVSHYGSFGDALSTVADGNSPGHYYVSLDGNGIYQTTNDGGEWTRLADWYDWWSGGVLAFSQREAGTLFTASGSDGVFLTQVEKPFPTPTPSPTMTETPGPTSAVTPTFTPPPGFPPRRTPTPTPGPGINVTIASGFLWVSPNSPGTGQSITVGLTVYNDSNENLLNVTVDLYWWSDSQPETHLSFFQIPSIPGWMQMEVPQAATLNPSSAGTYYVKAVIDQGNTIDESNESDNEAQISFYVRQSGADQVPPTGSVRINGGAPFTPNFEATLDLQATDNDSGVGYMWVTAWEYDAYTNSLYPYFDSGWIDYFTPAHLFLSAYWTGHIDAVSVNYADRDANISETYWAVVNYYQNQFTEFIFWDEWITYPIYLMPGNSVTLTLQNLSGDTDLYVVAPSTPPGSYAWASVQDGPAAENVTFTAPEEGVYWAFIYGYDFSEFRYLCGGSAGVKLESEPPAAYQKDDRRGPDLVPPLVGGTIPQNIAVPSFGVDFNGNGELDSSDLFYLAHTWGKSAGDPGYDARCGSAAPDRPVGAKHLLQWLWIKD